MRNLLLQFGAVLLVTVALAANTPAQNGRPANVADSNSAAQTNAPDLSGDWGDPVGAGPVLGFVISDPGDRKAGTPTGRYALSGAGIGETEFRAARNRPACYV